MKNISEVKYCYGCLACVDKCPVKCISESKNFLGHIMPRVDDDRCISCGLCLKVCPDLVDNVRSKPDIAVAAWDKNEIDRLKSSSGALATIIGASILNMGGVVYGCAFVPPFLFKHIRCSSLDSLERLRGSKYVQSNLNGVFKMIKKDIDDNLNVLFIGTPCQVAAVRNYIGEKPNLYTADLICHGVPSLQILKDSLPYRLLTSDISNIRFRDNNNFNFHIECDGAAIYHRSIHRDLYLKAFFTGLDYRDSCYQCKFTNDKRTSDITLGDFWGLKLNLPETEVERGISLCLPNTEKGKSLLGLINDDIVQYQRPMQEAIDGNKQLRHPQKKTFRAKLFRFLYPKLGFKTAVVCSIPEIIIKNMLMK